MDQIDENTQEGMTPEEYRKVRGKAIKELKKEIAYLKVEAEYQNLQANIEEHKARRLAMIQRQAQLMYGGQQQPTPQKRNKQSEEQNSDTKTSFSETKEKNKLVSDN